MGWWREGAVYQIYPRSFADANGDGIGDLAGLRSRLDYLQWLGIAAVWLNPITPSPNADWGYDVADYCSVDPDFGDLAELDALVAEAGRRGIRIVLDLVPNHTSNRHPWFVDSRSSPAAEHRAWYVWAAPKADGAPPNNWQSVFGGSAWTFDETSGESYLHNFLPSQPDLNWWSDEVRDEFDRILRFWFDRGVAGFRIDVAHALVKDRELRDDPPPTAADHPWVRSRPLKSVYSMNRPEVHEVFRRWRAIAEEYEPARLLLGETYVLDPAVMASYYGSDDELQLAFNFAFLHADFDPAGLRAVVEATEAALPPKVWPVWTASTHDAVRFPTRWCRDDPRLARCALLALLTLRGTPVLLYGDELGLPQTEVPEAAQRDMAGRDGARTPMPWTDAPGGGFTEPGVEPWLPFGDLAAYNVESQRDDPSSTLSLTRAVLRLRREVAELRNGPYASLSAPEGVWAWRRGERYAVAVNLGDEEATVEGLTGTVVLPTNRLRAGERLWGNLRLSPAEGALVELKP